MDNYVDIQARIQYNFTNLNFFGTALTHRSYLNENRGLVLEHNERLEFLGDAVLELVVTEYLFSLQTLPEGIMTNIRSSVVNYKILGQIGATLGLNSFIKVSKGEDSSKITIVADCLEALIGAIYLDGGFVSAKKFITTFVIAQINLANINDKDAKTTLQEYTQKHYKIGPKYKLISSEGKDHDKSFVIAVYLQNKEIGVGMGISKQEAETQAATQALENLQK